MQGWYVPPKDANPHQPAGKKCCTYIPLIVLVVVFLLITVRQVGRFNIRIWQIMLGGALAVLVSGQIAPEQALRAINPDVMLFLFGMFVIGEGLVQSGDLETIANRLFSRATDARQVVLVILFGLGTLSAILMNDTLAIIGTPLVLALAARNRMPPKLLLLTLAFAITTGSVMSPMGNPQNLLVAMGSGMPSPFVTFGLYLLLPTIISLIAAYGVLRFFYRDAFAMNVPFQKSTFPEHGSRLSFPILCSLTLLLVLAAGRIAASLAGIALPLSLPVIALAAAAPIILLSEKRVDVLRGIDWATLVFFAAMFVLMQSVWDAGVFQLLISADTVASVPVIIALAVVVSQFISNVPFVALFQPMILEAGGTTAQIMALAAGSTIAGNLTILGAASNVIIIQNAEREGETLSFFEFARIGIPLTIVQAGIFAIWLILVF